MSYFNDDNHYSECMEVNKDKHWDKYDCICESLYFARQDQKANENTDYLRDK